MTRWQRGARMVVGMAAVAIIVAVWLGLRERQPAPAPIVLSRTDLSATVESTGALVTQAKGEQQDFRIEAERQLTYADGVSRLENMTIVVPQDEGRKFVITGRRAEIREGQARMNFEGDVRITATGLEVVAEHAVYDHDQGVFEIAGPMRFTQGPFTGVGDGATYHSERDLLEIHDQARVSDADGEMGGDIDVSSRTAVLAGKERVFHFEGDVIVRHGAETADAQSAVAYLGDDSQRVESIELRGGSQVVSIGAASALRDMAAQDIDLLYGEDGRTVRRARLVGAASLHLSSGSDRPLRHITAERIDVALAPNGGNITELTANQRVLVELPQTDTTPTRRIRAASMHGLGDEAQGLHTIRFHGGVEYEETATQATSGPPTRRTVTSADLDVEVGANIADIQVANFKGDVVIRDADLTATAARARYDVTGGSVDLTGTETSPTRPHLDDRRGWLEAGRIQVSFGQTKRTVSAEQNVKSILNSAPPDGSDDTQSDRSERVPGLLAPDQPVNVTAASLHYDESTELATYSGAAKLWQGERAVQGETVVVDERNGDLQARGSARSRMVLDQIDPETGQNDPVDSVASGDELVYDDALRRATYTTNAHAIGPQGDITADRIELFFASEEDVLERVEAYTEARLHLERRTAAGQRLTYHARDGRYVMSGAPVRIVEDLETECRETTGQLLTFYQSEDTITVDSNNEHRTQTIAGDACPDLQPR